MGKGYILPLQIFEGKSSMDWSENRKMDIVGSGSWPLHFIREFHRVNFFKFKRGISVLGMYRFCPVTVVSSRSWKKLLSSLLTFIRTFLRSLFPLGISTASSFASNEPSQGKNFYKPAINLQPICYQKQLFLFQKRT